MIEEQQVNQWGQIVTKAWQDDAFKKRLLANPTAVLKEQGLEVSAGVQVRVVENTDQVIHLTLPAKPREGELSEDELENVAGGKLGGVLIRLSDDIKRAVTPAPGKNINRLLP
jgi:Nitrile hydratase, alpha chain